MAKLRTTKNQIHPQPYQFGGLNLPFLDQYTNLNKQWGSFWRGGDYFKQQAPNSIPDGTTMLDTTVKRNQGALDLYTDTQTRANNNYKGEWGDDAHNFYYRKDWDARNPNATQADKDRFDQYASFEKTAGNLKGPDYTEALLGAGIDPGDYNSWYKARDRGAGQFGAAYDKSRDIFNKDLPAARKQMGQAMTNSAAGIFSGLNYMNSYTPPETINMQQGSKGVMYSQMGGGVGPALSNYTVSSENPDKTINAFQGPLANYINFQGKGKILPNEFNTVINNNDVLEALTGVQGLGKAALRKLSKAQLIKALVAKNIPNAINTVGQQVLQETVGSWQDGGTIPFKAYGLTDSPMMRRHGALQPEAGSKFARWEDPRHAYNAVNDLLFSGNSKIYNPTMKVSDALKKYTGGDYGNKVLGNKRLKDLDQMERDTLTQFIMQKENSAQEHPMFDPIYNPDKVVGPSIMDYQVTSRQDGGNVNMEGYTPGYESMNNSINEIPSGDITMEQTPIPLLAIGKGGADNGLLKVLQPQSKGYNFKSKSTVEIPLEQQTQEQMKHSIPIAQYSFNNSNYLNPLQFGGYTPYFQGGGNVRRAVYQAANQEPFYQEPGMDTRFMTDARFNRPSLSGNSAVYQGTSNQLQSVPMLPTINPTVVEPMAGLGFNRDKMAAEIEVNNIKLKKGGTQKVAAYQQMLKAAGYNLDVDGAWGPKTQAAYEEYTGKKAPSKTAVNSGKAKVASNIIKNINYGYNSEVANYLKSNNIEPNSENIQAFYNNTVQPTASNNLSQVVNNTAQSNLSTDNFSMPSFNDILPSFTPWGSDTIYRPEDYLPTVKRSSNIVPTKEQVAKYNKPRKKWNEKNPKLFGSNVHPSLARTFNKLGLYTYGGSVPKFQFGGSINDEHSIPIFSSNLEDFGLTELQTEKNEVAFMPDGSIVDVKAKELHKKQDKHNVSDIMQSGTYVFSNDPKMKFGIKSKIGGVELGEMKLGKSVFKYKENEITPGPEDIMLKTMFFNNSKKELTTADIAKNVKKNLPIIDLKNDYFADRAIAENKDQRLEYLSILKAFNEFKKPKSRSIPKAQYGMPIQPTQNGLDGVMGYGDKQMDPFKRMDNNMVSMWNMPQPKLPTIPRMYENGGTIPQAQFGWLADGIDAIGGWSRRAKRDQERKNAILAREAQGYRDELQRGVNTAGGIGVGTNLATYAAALNVPLQKYDDQSEQMSLYNAAANRAAQRLEASKYTASQGIGGASSLARYSNPTNYGDYLSKVQSQSDSNIGRINQAIADLDMAIANQNVGFVSARNAGRNQSLDARDTQLYNANIQGIGNVGRSAQEATFNTADTKYRLGNEKMAYDAYLTDKAEAAKQAKQQQIRGYTNEIGLLGLTAATGGFGNLGGGSGANNIVGSSGVTAAQQASNNAYMQNGMANSMNSLLQNRNNSFNPIQPLPLILNRNGVNNGNFMNRNTDNWNYNFLDVNTWR